jgi:hypothetical protein
MLLGIALLALVGAAAPAQIRTEYGHAYAPLSDAEDLIGLLRNGSYYEASQSFIEGARGTYTPERLQQMWESQLKRLGRLQSFQAKAADVDGTSWRIHVICTFEKGAVDAVVIFNTLASDSDPSGLSFSAAPLGDQGPFKVQ